MLTNTGINTNNGIKSTRYYDSPFSSLSSENAKNGKLTNGILFRNYKPMRESESTVFNDYYHQNRINLDYRQNDFESINPKDKVEYFKAKKANKLKGMYKKYAKKRDKNQLKENYSEIPGLVDSQYHNELFSPRMEDNIKIMQIILLVIIVLFLFGLCYGIFTVLTKENENYDPLLEGGVIF